MSKSEKIRKLKTFVFSTYLPDFNPIALRTAKTQMSFGRSECNRVKQTEIQNVANTAILSFKKLNIPFWNTLYI